MTERARGAIALMPTGNEDGSWWYFILKTGKPVRRTNATALPMPEEIIEVLNNLARDSKSKLKVGELKSEVIDQLILMRILDTLKASLILTSINMLQYLLNLYMWTEKLM